MNAIVRAGEQARECNDLRQKSQFAKALEAARKALATEPNLPAAYLCVATVYEAQRMPVDSQLVAYQRAAALDSLNATAWENIARLYQQKGDTLKAIGAFIHELQGEPQNTQLRLGIAELLRLQKQYQQAVNLLDEGLARNAADQKMAELKQRICLEGELWRCVVDGFVQQLKSDSIALMRLRSAFADRLDSARVYQERAATAPDSATQVNAAAIMRSAGEKLIRAGASDRAVPWLQRTLALVAPRTPADTAGLRHAIRANASFWYGLAAMSVLPAEYQAMTKAKNCTEAKAFNDHLAEVRAALTLGRSVHPPTVDTTLLGLAKFEGAMASVKKAFKCRNF